MKKIFLLFKGDNGPLNLAGILGFIALMLCTYGIFNGSNNLELGEIIFWSIPLLVGFIGSFICLREGTSEFFQEIFRKKEEK